MKTFLSDCVGRKDEDRWFPLYLDGLAVREAKRILAETEPREPGDTEYARLDDVRYFRRKARTDADTRSVFAAQHSAHAALAEALAAFVAK